MSKTKNLKLAGAGLAVIVLGTAVIFRQDAANAWNAHKKNQLALNFIKQEQWTDALQAEHEATDLRPGAADYQLTYMQIRRSFLRAAKPRLAILDPVTYLATVHTLVTQLGPALDDDGENQFQSWCYERETAALDEANAPFDTDEAALGKIFQGRESFFVDMFSPGNQAKAHTLLAAWQNLDAAETAWKSNDADRVAALLDKIPADYRKLVYTNFEKRLDGVRQQIRERWDAANKLVIQNDYLGAKPLFADLQRHEAWIPGLQAARLAAQSGGEGFFTEKMVEANMAKQYHDAGNWLFQLMTLQGQNTKGINFDGIFKGGTTADFLNLLTGLGLHPGAALERKNFTDVLLVAANMENLTDAGAAQHFLGDTYLDWATKEYQSGHYGNAGYLSLLATKHGNAAASEVFDKARAAGLDQLIVVVAAQPPVNQVSSADKDFSDELYNAAVNTVHDSLLPWMKYEDSGNPFTTTATNGLFRVRIKAGISKFSPDYQRNIRSVSREFPVKVIVDNPALPGARQQAEQAQETLTAAQRKYQSDKQTAELAGQATRMAANQIFGGFGGIIAGGLAGGAVANSVSTAGVDAAAQALTSAQNDLANMPPQVEQTQNKLFTWNETDHTTTYHATFQLGLGVSDSNPWSQSFNASVTHKSTERRGIDQVNLAPLEREQPDLQKIESILAADLKRQIQALGKAGALAGIKTSLQKSCASEGAALTTGLDTRLNLELLWWNTPLRDYRAFATSELLGKFGDVVNAPGAAASQRPTPTPTPTPMTAPQGALNTPPASPQAPPAQPQAAATPPPTASPLPISAAAVTAPEATIPLNVDQGSLVGVVVVMGEVHNPSVSIPCKEKTTVLEAIQAAGGFTDAANKSEVRVFPQGKLKDAFSVDCQSALANPLKDSPVHPDDHIIVQRRAI